LIPHSEAILPQDSMNLAFASLTSMIVKMLV
jgi:hypothetical protein